MRAGCRSPSSTITRECLALVADTSLWRLRVARELDAIIRLGGWPETIVSDKGTELTSMAILRWCQETAYSSASRR